MESGENETTELDFSVISSTPPPGYSERFQEFIAYATGQRKVFAAYTILMLCEFGRWFSWALCPWFRFFSGLTNHLNDRISLEFKAELTLKPNPMLPWLAGMAVGPIAFTNPDRLKKILEEVES